MWQPRLRAPRQERSRTRKPSCVPCWQCRGRLHFERLQISPSLLVYWYCTAPPPPHLRSRGHSEQPQIAPRGATLPESRKQKVLERAHSTETQGGCRKRRAPHQLSTTGCITSETAPTASAPLLYKEGR